MAEKSPEALRKHVFETYHSLRKGLFVIGIILPFALLLDGWFLHNALLEGSLSAYYHTTAQVRFLVARDLFVGGLLAAAACLYLYKGFSDRENILLNIAAICATVVALFPTTPKDGRFDAVTVIHGSFAVLFFLCIAFVSLFHSQDTLELITDESTKKNFARGYKITGIAMVLFPVVAVVVSFVLDLAFKKRVILYLLETCGFLAFCAYWKLKSREMLTSFAEEDSLAGHMERTRETTSSSVQKSVADSMSGTLETVERIRRVKAKLDSSDRAA